MGNISRMHDTPESASVVEEPADLTSGDVAKRLSVTTKTVGRWAERGLIPSRQLPSGHRRFRRSDVEAIERGEVPA